MKKFAVALVSFYDNDLTLEFHEGTSWKEALGKHSKFENDVATLDDFIETAQRQAFDGDWLFAVKELP